MLQELADSLAKTPVVIVLPNIKLANGSKLKKVAYFASISGYGILYLLNFSNENRVVYSVVMLQRKDLTFILLLIWGDWHR